MKPWTVPLFVIVSALGPIALLVRYGLLAPLSLLSSALRRTVVERYSSLSINPDYRRRMPEGDFRRMWIVQETAASLWAITLLTLVATGTVPLRAFLIVLSIHAGVVVINQFRTLVAHLWENDGDVMTVTGQYLDSVNVPPPALLPALWAPVGLRYHALHHLLPGLPYHALGEAHRRLIAALPATSRYLPPALAIAGLRPHFRQTGRRTIPSGWSHARRKVGSVYSLPPGPYHASPAMSRQLTQFAAVRGFFSQLRHTKGRQVPHGHARVARVGSAPPSPTI
jgi:hypothetical protein